MKSGLGFCGGGFGVKDLGDMVKFDSDKFGGFVLINLLLSEVDTFRVFVLFVFDIEIRMTIHIIKRIISTILTTPAFSKNV